MATGPSRARKFGGADMCCVCDLKFKDEDQLRWHLEEVHDLFVKMPPVNEHDCVADKIRLLKKVLKENIADYLTKLFLWIRCDITRSEFDHEVRPLFTPETIVIHNEFLISFLKQIRSMTRDHGKGWTKHNSSIQTEAPGMSCFDAANNNRIQSVGDIAVSLKEALPDQETAYALSLVTAWENECPSVNKKIVPLLSNAVEVRFQTIVRNILMAIMLMRKVRADGFVYDVGKADPKNIQSEEVPKYTGNITLPELLETLEAKPTLIPIKSVYKLTIQRILTSLEKKRPETQDFDEEENT